MAAAKTSADPMRNIPGCTLVTAMARNGTEFGIRMSGTGDRWFTAPSPIPAGSCSRIHRSVPTATRTSGDSAITETVGLGGMAMAASPAVVPFTGGASVREAVAITREMGEICAGPSPHYRHPGAGV